MAAYGQGNPLLRDHSSRFVCILYFLAKGVRDCGFDSDRVYGELDAGGISDQHQARAELIQYLQDLQQPPIEYDRGTNTVRLTRTGLEWANNQCDTPVYLMYRHLQN
jgi:hypothetical protein